ncbi:hypothetical protein P389DRAFT_153560 [Cystobasidium minutum MCA 4210]|uniref:uncharacterized protein n=1 Tax=Cystobasidium minutum MCA 4210 TaxID=1397322 RepID=UPI0034CD958A|eukprot:jgi/Rhomi1/153560/estExt_Genewise1.C_5_t10013
MPLDRRTYVTLGAETVSNGSATDFPGYQESEDGLFNENAFQNRLQVTLTRMSNMEVELDVVGVDASVANAIRRVLLAEVPTVAVEHVYIWNNTSIIQDEVLSQRLGLVPLAIDPKKVEFKGHEEEPTDLNTIVFSLVVKCERDRSARPNERDINKLYHNTHVYSSAFSWQAKGIQEETFGNLPPKPVFEDILLAKLRPNQEILLEMHCEKGIGKDHAKWSPVATASYRLLPTIQITKEIPPHLCDTFAKCFSPGVIAVSRDASGQASARVANARKDTLSREVLRHQEFSDSVELGRKRDHYIFNVESAGQYRAADLIPAALEVLLSKIKVLQAACDLL